MVNILTRAAADHYGYKAENIILLADDATNPRHIPTRKNMLDAMRWLVEGAHKHDSLHFHCALLFSLFTLAGVFMAYWQTQDTVRGSRTAMATRSTASTKSFVPSTSASQELSWTMYVALYIRRGFEAHHVR